MDVEAAIGAVEVGEIVGVIVGNMGETDVGVSEGELEKVLGAVVVEVGKIGATVEVVDELAGELGLEVGVTTGKVGVSVGETVSTLEGAEGATVG